MAEEKKDTFPLMPVKHWWALRKKFKATIPSNVSGNYLAATLNMQVRSATGNVLPGLKQVGLVNDDETTNTDLAKRWRDDQNYPKVCASMKAKIYPEELLQAVPDPKNDRDAASRWFANHTGGGQVAVRKMVTFYELLCEADPKKQEETKAARKRAPDKPKAKGAAQSSSRADPVPRKQKTHAGGESEMSGGPSLHLTVQIHLSADASMEQIDQMFASMAKHIYREKPTRDE